MIVPQQNAQDKNTAYSVVYGIGGFICGLGLAVVLIFLAMISPFGRDAGALIIVPFGLMSAVPLGFVFARIFARIGANRPLKRKRTMSDNIALIIVILLGILGLYLLYKQQEAALPF